MNLYTFTEKIRINFVQTLVNRLIEEKSGTDNIERVCEYCGKIFISGKYQKRRFCNRSCAAYARKKKNGVIRLYGADNMDKGGVE